LELRPNFISVARRGQAHITGPGATTGLAPVNGSSVIDIAATDTTSVKIFEITPPDGATALAPTDIINFGLYRPTDGAADTCSGDLVIQGIVAVIGD
jgi:hypothetical protein